ncbi:MAG: hypothetical protein AB4352_22180, partial [Hormoscilla sp.]
AVPSGENDSDTLSGGAGADNFLFNSPNTGLDIITDFVGNEDRIGISVEGFGSGLQGTGTVPELLDPTQFIVATTATSPEHRLIYNETNGNLLFDADGNGSAEAVVIVTLAGNTLISAGDILLF